MPVAMAAPLIPSCGKGPMPNIISGSRMMFVMQPAARQNIVVFIRPVDWDIFSHVRNMQSIGAKRKTYCEYSIP